MEYKPLSELAKDEVACSKILKCATGDSQVKAIYSLKDKCLIRGNSIEIDIRYDGHIIRWERDHPSKFNAFALVKKIMELGYSA